MGGTSGAKFQSAHMDIAYGPQVDAVYPKYTHNPNAIDHSNPLHAHLLSLAPV